MSIPKTVEPTTRCSRTLEAMCRWMRSGEPLRCVDTSTCLDTVRSLVTGGVTLLQQNETMAAEKIPRLMHHLAERVCLTRPRQGTKELTLGTTESVQL